MNKKQLYESIMKQVSKEVKKTLNESDNLSDYERLKKQIINIVKDYNPYSAHDNGKSESDMILQIMGLVDLNIPEPDENHFSCVDDVIEYFKYHYDNQGNGIHQRKYEIVDKNNNISWEDLTALTIDIDDPDDTDNAINKYFDWVFEDIDDNDKKFIINKADINFNKEDMDVYIYDVYWDADDFEGHYKALLNLLIAIESNQN